MAWDDAPPDAGGWDAAPPTPDELKPSYLEDVGSNALKEIKAIPGSIPTMAKQALGIADLPLDVLKAGPEMLEGKSLSETSAAEDVAPIIQGNKNTVETVEHPIESFRKAPINTAGTALGLLGAGKALIPGAEAPIVPRGEVPLKQVELPDALQMSESGAAPKPEMVSPVPPGAHGPVEEGSPAISRTTLENEMSQLHERLPKEGKTPEGAVPGVPGSAIPSAPSGLPKTAPGDLAMPASSSESTFKPPESLKDLPVMQPGIKTGEPHALFAYNDDLGPGKTPRSLYNIFGNPGDPRVTAAGGYGSSVTKDILDKAGIPVVGRDPRSVGKWDPIETAVKNAPTSPPRSEPPPKAAPEAGLPPKPSIFETGAQKAIDEAKELKDYVSRGYEGYAKKPGAIADVADWVQEKSQMMAAQQIGVTPNQARQLGKSPLASHNAMRAIGQYALDHDIVSPTTGLGGMLEKNNALMKSVGKTLGDYRSMADKTAGEIDPKAIVAEVRKALDNKYMRVVKNAEGEESGPRGAYGGQAGAYMKALQEVEDAEKSHSGIADAATELNHAANKAAKNMQPETPFTDVANEVSRINNAKIKQLIGADNAAKYEQALREYGVNKKIANALKFKSSGEVKRFGPGSFTSNMTQKLMDEAGYRLGSKVANKVSTAIKNNPKVAGSLPSMFKEFIHQVEDVNHDVTGMSKGGMVPDDVKRFVSSKC